jgi:hypothetical protein
MRELHEQVWFQSFYILHEYNIINAKSLHKVKSIYFNLKSNY